MLWRAEWWQRLLPLIYHHWSYCGGAGQKVFQHRERRRLASRLISATCSFHRICLTNDALSGARGRKYLLLLSSLPWVHSLALLVLKRIFDFFVWCEPFFVGWCVWVMRIQGAATRFYADPNSEFDLFVAFEQEKAICICAHSGMGDAHRASFSDCIANWCFNSIQIVYKILLTKNLLYTVFVFVGKIHFCCMLYNFQLSWSASNLYSV